ncbi:hypothetical protein H3N56_02650 [Cetobacterium sp. 2A]|uniref:hypothetical protein n=1 Tax=Cetobacterium sp. 2A TaxID=2754723 RepID=UPI00163C09DC|nr:hypothetical protein [Cetobacterium sp. 2A]MBC2855393.1 hypothetical protein [Cetobacterium sp. 2A]
MSKVRLDIKNMLQNSIDKPNVKKEEEYTYEVDSIINLDLIRELSDDNEISKLLVDKTKSLINLQIKNAISLGEIFTSVFDKLSKSGSKYEGLYEKWLQLNDINKKTALRYRKRYELYSMINNKETIAIMPQKYIDILYSEEDKTKYIELIEKGATSKEIIEYIDSQGIVELKTVNLIEERDEIFNHIPKYLNFSKEINRKIETLDEKKKRDLQKYLDKIDKILN